MYNINFEHPESVIDHIMCGMARAMFDISYMRFIDRFDNGDDEMPSQTERDFVSLLFEANAILRPTHGEKNAYWAACTPNNTPRCFQYQAVYLYAVIAALNKNVGPVHFILMKSIVACLSQNVSGAYTYLLRNSWYAHDFGKNIARLALGAGLTDDTFDYGEKGKMIVPDMATFDLTFDVLAEGIGVSPDVLYAALEHMRVLVETPAGAQISRNNLWQDTLRHYQCSPAMAALYALGVKQKIQKEKDDAQKERNERQEG